MPDWKFLTNHALVLAFLAGHPKITARDLARNVGITERAVRKIIADLDNAGYIKKTKEGRRIRYWVNPYLPLRHHMHQDTAVGQLLETMGTPIFGRRPKAAASLSRELLSPK